MNGATSGKGSIHSAAQIAGITVMKKEPVLDMQADIREAASIVKPEVLVLKIL